jgi:predicted RNA binding protein YcfA (HicA-like mRNA interferase family)
LTASKLPAVTAKEVVEVALKTGFVLDRQKGSHAVFKRRSDGTRIVIPVHPGRTLKPKTLKGILDDMGLTPENFTDLLRQ